MNENEDIRRWAVAVTLARYASNGSSEIKSLLLDLRAVSKDEAVGKAIRWSNDKFPSSDGWVTYQPLAMEITAP